MNKSDQVNYVQCHHVDRLIDYEEKMSILESIGKRCGKRVIDDGHVYCKEHFPLHHSEQYNSRLDSGSGLPTYLQINLLLMLPLLCHIGLNYYGNA